MHSKKIIIILSLIFSIIFCTHYSKDYLSAKDNENGYLIHGFSGGFYLIDDNLTSCTLIENSGKTTLLFHQDNATILKAITSKSNLYILIEQDDLIAVFTYSEKGNMETPYAIDADIKTSTFISDDNNFYFITNNSKSVLKINRNQHLTEEISFTKSIKTLFYYDECVYAITDNTILSLNNPSVVINSAIPNYSDTNPINIHDSKYIDNSGRVYSFNINSGFSLIKSLNYNKCIPFNNSYCSLNGNTIYLLSNSGTKEMEYNYSMNIYDLCVNKDKIAILSSNGVEIITSKDFIPINNENPNVSNTNINKFYTKYKTVNNYILVTPATTITEMKKNININSETYLKFYDISGKTITSGNVRTGYSVVHYINDSSQNRYTIIIKGDIVGEGFINTSDKRKLIDYLLNKCELNEMQKYAIDLNEDGKVDSLDLLMLEREIK